MNLFQWKFLSPLFRLEYIKIFVYQSSRLEILLVSYKILALFSRQYSLLRYEMLGDYSSARSKIYL